MNTSGNTTTGTTYTIQTTGLYAAPGRYWEGIVAQPTVRRNAAGMDELNWPAGHPNVCLVSRELLVQMVAEINELRVLRRWVERDVS